MSMFEKKVIIGSVAGFVASAVGVIAVFFPSVFNLEKKSIAENKVFLHTLKSANEFVEWLKKQENSIVKLEIYYCASEPEYYDDYMINEFGEKVNENHPFKIQSTYYEDVESGIITRISGGFSVPTDELKEYGIESLIHIHSNDADAEYEWYTNVLPPSKEIEKTCDVQYYGTELLKGTFYVNKGSLSANYVRQGGEAFEIHIDPMSKKALQLRNY